MYIAENLKALRKSKGMTQEEAAEMLNVSPQSISKWERGETYPDITLLPTLANLYGASVDEIIGMDRINSAQARSSVFTEAHEHMRNDDFSSAAAVLGDALKTFPNDEGLMSDLALALALEGTPEKLDRAAELCERVLAGQRDKKVYHTTRAALSFIWLKRGDEEKAAAAAGNLPHVRESREMILAEFAKNPTAEEIDAYLKFIAVGESGEQSIICIELGTGMVSALIEAGLTERIRALRAEVTARRLPSVQIRDNPALGKNQVRVRHYASILLDKCFGGCAAAAEEILAVLRNIGEIAG